MQCDHEGIHLHLHRFHLCFQMLQEQSNIFDWISFVSCNCQFDLSGLSGCCTCFPSEAAAYVKSPPKHMFPFPTIISIENNSFVSNSRPSAQSGLKMKTSCFQFLSSLKCYRQRCQIRWSSLNLSESEYIQKIANLLRKADHQIALSDHSDSVPFIDLIHPNVPYPYL